MLTGMPVMVAWGSDDRTIPPHHHRTVAQQLPNAVAVEILAAGHYPHETAPEDLLPRLVGFLGGTEAFCYNETRWLSGLIA